MNIFTYIKSFIDNRSFQTKLFLSYICLGVLPILLLMTIFYFDSSNTMRKQNIQISEQQIRQAEYQLDARFSEMLTVSNSITQQSTIRKLVDIDNAPGNMADQAIMLDNLETTLHTLYTPSDMKIRLFVNDDLLFSKRDVLTYPLSSLGKYYNHLKFSDISAPVLMGPVTYYATFSKKQKVYSILSPIHSQNDYMKTTAALSVDIPRDKIASILSDADFSGKGSTYLMDIKNHTGMGYDNASKKILSVPANYAGKQFQTGSTIHGRYLQSISSPVWDTYRIMVIAPLTQLAKNNYSMLARLSLIVILLGILVYIAAYFYSRQNSRRIIELSRNMKEVQKGNLGVRCIIGNLDEIGELQGDFNQMSGHINTLLRQQYQLGQKLKDSELKLLQAQIDPHFLYNTLNLIIWTAQNKSPDDVSNIVTKLSRYYRISLSNGNNFIKLSEELEHVKLYVELQNIRFQNSTALCIHLPNTLQDFYIPKLTLQPLVENCFIHGFRQSAGSKNTIDITIAQESTCIKIVISDNGIGISPIDKDKLQIKNIFGPNSTSSGGYGMSNIIDRLKTYYGTDATLEITDADRGRGTSVVIRIPSRQKD